MKTRLTFALTACICLLWSCTSATSSDPTDNASAAPAGKIFLRTVMWGSSLQISWVYLGNDGTIIYNPKHGVNPVNIAAEVADNAANTGNYKVVGSTLKITWKDGKSASWNFEKEKGEFSAIDGGICTKPEQLPSNYKLNSTYSGGAVTANLSASSTLKFTPDGKFTEGRTGTVSTAATSAISSNQRGGTYLINGNTLKLKYTSGETYTAVVGIYKISPTLTYFIINTTSYKQL